MEEIAKLEYRCKQGRRNTYKKAEIGNDTGESGQQANQQGQLKANHPQTKPVNNPKTRHHQQLPTNKGAQHLIAVVHQLDRQGLIMAWNHVTAASNDQIPVTQQIKTYHRDHHQIRSERYQRHCRLCGLGNHRSQYAGGLPQMLFETVTHAIETEITDADAQARLNPWQGGIVEPVNHGRNVIAQCRNLMPQQRNQDNQSQNQHTGGHGEDHHHPKGARQTALLQPIHQRITKVGQQHANQRSYSILSFS